MVVVISELVNKNIFSISRSSYFKIIIKFFTINGGKKAFGAIKMCHLMKLKLWLARVLYKITCCFKEVHFAGNK